MSDTNQGLGGEYDEAEFFVELTTQRLERTLAGFELATGKLPTARQMFAGGALREQHPIRAVPDDARDHVNFRAQTSAVGLLQRTVTVLVFAARSAGTGFITPDLRHRAHERSRGDAEARIHIHALALGRTGLDR